MIDEQLIRSSLLDARKQGKSQTQDQSNAPFRLSPELGDSGCRVGVNADGLITLMVPAVNTHQIALARLRYVPSARVEFVDVSDRWWTSSSGFISCDVESPAEEDVLVGVFVQIVNALDLGAAPTVIPTNVAALQALFSALQQPSQRAEIGLWGELFVIANARDALALASSWVSDESSVFDFAKAGSRLEIKTTTGALRRHIFAITQLEQAKVTDTAVLSLMTTEVASGSSLSDLLSIVQTKLRHHPELQHALLEKTVRVAGKALTSPRYYDVEQARGTARLFAFSSIPSPELCPGIVDLTWTVQLDVVRPSDVIEGNILVDAYL